jgi:metal-responsive CopG/Arc/MetJ family transcriptional regulator
MINIRIPEELLARLDDWREQLPVVPNRTQTICAAISDWLDEFADGEE